MGSGGGVDDLFSGQVVDLRDAGVGVPEEVGGEVDASGLVDRGRHRAPEPVRRHAVHPGTDRDVAEPPADVVGRARRSRRNEEHPNIFLRRQFWCAPHEPEKPGVHEAPWLLVYADLLASNDSRQCEAAQQIR